MKTHSIKSAILIRFLIILVSIVLLTVVVFSGAKSIMDTEEYTRVTYSVISTLYQSETGHYRWVTNLREAIDGDAEFTGSRDATQCILGKHIYSAEVQENPDVSGLVSQIEPLHLAIHEQANIALESNSVDAQRIYRESIAPNVHQLTLLLDEAIESRLHMIDTAQAELNDMLVMYAALIILAVLATLAVCTVIYLYIKRRITDPILHIAKKAHSLSKGQLNLDFTVPSKNEIGELGAVLNTSVHEISMYIKDIDRAMQEFSKGNFDVYPSQPFIGDFSSIESSISGFLVRICKMLQTAKDTSHQVTSGAGLLSDSTQILSQGSMAQAASIEELNATINEISTIIQNNAEQAGAVNELVGKTGEKVVSCNDQMASMVAAMSAIAQKSDEIRKINKTVEDIAFQTNILALNASVEAARAGTAGKGFAVVADEVRNLAAKSGEAANVTSKLVNDTLIAVRNGEDIATLTASSLTEIVEGTRAITERVLEINKANRDQAASVRQIEGGVEHISQVVQTSSASAQESAAACEELSAQAAILNQQVGSFVLLQKMPPSEMSAKPPEYSTTGISLR